MGTIFQVNESNGNVTITGAVDVGSHQIHSVTDPTSAQDAATKNYVDNIAVAGVDWKQAVRLATAAALPSNTYANGSSGVGATLTATANGALSVDGTAVATNDRILVKNEATVSHNGIYTVTATGDGSNPYVLTRATDYNTPSEMAAGTVVATTTGSTLADTIWIQTNVITTVGTSNVTFSQFGQTFPLSVSNGGTGLSTLTAHAVLLGEGTSNVAFAGPGTTNFALVSNGASSDPSFQAVVNSITGTANQVIASSATGSVTLSLPQSIATSSSPTFASETLTNTTNQLVLGTTNTTTISSTAPSASRTYTIPDAGATANFVLDQGNYTIGGSWTFSTAPSFSTALSVSSGGTGQTSYTDGQLLIGKTTGNTLNKTTLTGTANQITVTNGSGTITLSTPQNIATTSSPTFAAETLTNTTNQLVLGTTNTTTISSTAPAASRTYTIPDAGGSANVVLDAGNYTIGGTWTFSNPITITPTTNQLVLGTTRTVTLSATQPATSSRTYTIPDQGANANIVGDKANYTIGGTWTFSNNVTLASSKDIVFTDNTTNTVSMKATNSTTSWTFSLPTTAGTSNFFLQTDGSGNTTWASGGSGTISSGTTNEVAVYTASTTIGNPTTAVTFGSQKISSIANGTASTDAAAFGQIYYGFQSPVQGSLTTSFSTTSGTFQATGLNASITPTSSSHRVKITASLGVLSTTGVSADDVYATISKNGTNLGTTFGMSAIAGTVSGSLQVPCTLTWIDSPASTSSLTYEVYIRTVNSAVSAGINGQTSRASIILEEIV